jgi:hypothetical protein
MAILWMVISKHPKTMNVNFYHPISMIELMEPFKETLKALNISSDPKIPKLVDHHNF